jgi:hypothetical protein
MAGTMQRIRNRLQKEGKQRLAEVTQAYMLVRSVRTNYYGKEVETYTYRLVVDLGGEQPDTFLDTLADNFPHATWISVRGDNVDTAVVHDTAEQGIRLCDREPKDDKFPARILYCLSFLDDGIRFDTDNVPCRVGQVYPVLEKQSATLGLHATMQAKFSRKRLSPAVRSTRGERLDDSELENGSKLVASTSKGTMRDTPKHPVKPVSRLPLLPVLADRWNSRPVGCKFSTVYATPRETGNVPTSQSGKSKWNDKPASRLPLSPSGVPTCKVETRQPAFTYDYRIPAGKRFV